MKEKIEFKLKLYDISPPKRRGPTGKRNLRFSLRWECNIPPEVLSDEIEGCLCSMATNGNIVWGFHLVSTKTGPKDYHNPSPDLYGRVQKMLANDPVVIKYFKEDPMKSLLLDETPEFPQEIEENETEENE